MTRRAAVLTLAVAGAALWAGAGGAGAATGGPVSIAVDARPGKVAVATAALRRSGLKVQRREGRRLQVVADPRRASALARIPGVAGARPATTAFADAGPAVSQGLERSGSDVLGRIADGGAGLTIAVLDLGFGQNLGRLQALGELPPPERLETLSFDAAGGLAGTNAYGNRTNHGELVAQTVFDYAPSARYLFVNYHSDADFLAATDAVIARRPDIVVHSNSFIEGPFDGTSPAARAVDRAAAAGILWFNSAGNYARLHWSGPWSDADADSDLDWPNGDNWTFPRAAGLPITFALSWPAPASGPPADLDLALERQGADGAWSVVATSADRQSQGAPPAERIVGYSPPADGVYRLRAVRISGPAPTGALTLFSREIALATIGGTVEGSIPTPPDARGAIAVGATDWRGNSLKSYSAQGPTADGRLKPDLTAPTNTRVMGPSGPRAVGGTSNAAPNAAGAAAGLRAAQRRTGLVPNADGLRA
ncbi:MAG: S8 family serine peptidase, partial [Blastococcus sp.]|nr:S8 family serine peptidase [Blastococcus sp.]